MTQSAQSVSATPASPIKNKMKLGAVTFQNRRYLAVLHYHGDDGNALTLKENMKTEAIREIYRDHLQKMLDEVKGDSPESPLEAVSTSGFSFTEGNNRDLSHSAVKTQKAWSTFLFLLEFPEEASHIYNSVELIDITEFTKQWQQEHIPLIIEKLDTKIAFDKDEMRFLKAFDCEKLSEGIKNNKEILKLTTLIDPLD